MKLANIENLASKGKQQGFTLLELIIALTLSAALILAVMMVFKNVSTSWVRSDELVTNTEADLLGMQFVRRIVGDTLPVSWSDIENKDKVAFVGKGNSMSFVARLPVANAEALGLYLYTLSVDKTKDSHGSALVISYQEIDWQSMEKTTSGKAKKEVILDNVQSFKISYFGKKQKAGTDSTTSISNNNGNVDGTFASNENDLADETWSNDWNDQKNLPLAIKISVKRNTYQNKNNDDYIPPTDWEDITIRLPHQHIR